MDRNNFKTRIIDYNLFPTMSEEEHELMVEDLSGIEDFTEFTAYLERIGVVLEPMNPLELSTQIAGTYDTIH